MKIFEVFEVKLAGLQCFELVYKQSDGGAWRLLSIVSVEWGNEIQSPGEIKMYQILN